MNVFTDIFYKYICIIYMYRYIDQILQITQTLEKKYVWKERLGRLEGRWGGRKEKADLQSECGRDNGVVLWGLTKYSGSI